MPEEPFLVEHDEDDDTTREELEDEIDKDPDPRVQQEKQKRQKLQGELDQSGDDLNRDLRTKELRKKLTTEPDKTPDVDVSDPTPSAALDEKKGVLKKADEKTGEGDESSTRWTAGAYLGLFSSIAVAGSLVWVVVDYLVDLAHKKPTDDNKLDPAIKTELDSLLDDWKSLPDPKFWERLATYVESPKCKLTLGDQLVFMKLTVMLGGLSGNFLWDCTQDESDMADSLIKAYHGDNKKNSAADMYRAAAKVTYRNQPVPRVVMAEVLQLALAWVGARTSKDVN